MDWLDQYFEKTDDFPRPNWEGIYRHIDDHLKGREGHELWCQISRNWIDRLKSELSENYSIHESENFLVLTSESKKYVGKYLKCLERTHKRILDALHDIASDEGFGKYVVLIFDDIDIYYSYMAHFYPEEGEFGISSGIYLNTGYGHFAFPHQDLLYAGSITAHEMTHALVSHLPIPAWLNEGMAVNIENMITRSAPLGMDRELFEKHQNFWGEDEIQEFWTGASFHRPDEGQELSYHLAQLMVNSISHDYGSFIAFANLSDFRDGGESAAHEIYGKSLGRLIANILGEGSWAPKLESTTNGPRR
ncbi:MAG: hypothetical protein AAF492_00850 [Verrucomicrobiota bacterium]